ncbi:hypothetical protein FXO21_00965 [Dyadobacter sp. UC 10]|nr:hypothetical protein FXO21_00965 [Dyadobacter sp. UC 10]
MKFIVPFLLSTALICCKAKRDENISATETLKSPPVAEHKSDSSEEVRKSKIALPGINFGISLKEYQAANKYILQGFGANTYFVKPLFNNQSQLFKIELAGISRNASYSDTKLWEDHKNLISFLEADNGTPKTLSSAPKLSEIKPGGIEWTHSWSNFSKRIKVGIAQGTTGETYEVIGWIYDQSMLKKKKLADSLMTHPQKKTVAKSKKRGKRAKNSERSATPN